jgi:hypothetical protein
MRNEYQQLKDRESTVLANLKALEDREKKLLERELLLKEKESLILREEMANMMMMGNLQKN